MPAHKHADLMMQYAKDAAETETPWMRWEVLEEKTGEWGSLYSPPRFCPELKYRRKPRTIRIGDYDVPEPEREPLELGQQYYYVNLGNADCWYCDYWANRGWEIRLLKMGLIHLTRSAAELHARALISLTAKGD